MKLRRFQKRFIAGATAPGIDTAALSLPRGNGKSALAGHLITRILTPGDKLFRAGTESVLCAASLEQARICFRFARGDLEPTGEYRFLDSHQRIGITHRETNTRLRVISSNARTAMGLVGTPWAVCDEPGSWETRGGELMWDALATARGKPNSPLRILLIGTLAPATAGWWHSMIEGGSTGNVHVQDLRGDPARWDDWNEIRRVNPLTAISADFRKTLLQERDEARADTRLKARFLSYRLNVPSGDESTVLLTVDDWLLVTARPVAERCGKPIVGVDLGAGRAWSAAVAVWPGGRTEALAIAPGIPSIAEQEQQDRVPTGTYARLIENGTLTVSHELRVQPPADLYRAIREAWGAPQVIFCDRFKIAEMQDAVRGAVPLIERLPRWSDSTADIRALRKFAKDGPLSCEHNSRALLTASLSVSMVKNDDAGNTRPVKRFANNCARDDVAIALILAAGALSRAPKRRPARYAVG